MPVRPQQLADSKVNNQVVEVVSSVAAKLNHKV